MANKPRYTQEQMITALRANRGMVSGAAKSLNCETTTVYAYINKYPAVAAVLVQERERTTDVAELALFGAIEAKEPWAVCFYLKTQGKGRGYVERQEVTGRDGGPVQTQTQIVTADDLAAARKRAQEYEAQLLTGAPRVEN